MNVSEVLNDALDRLPELVRAPVEGLSPEQLRWAPAEGANPIGWLVWHLIRVQDHHVAEVLGEEQVYLTGDWAKRFGVQPVPSDVGYGHSADDVAALRPESWQTLVEYGTAVSDRTRAYVAGLSEADLDRVVDDNWDPPVTLGVRLISVLNDDIQHAGQAAYVRGLLPES